MRRRLLVCAYETGPVGGGCPVCPNRNGALQQAAGSCWACSVARLLSGGLTSGGPVIDQTTLIPVPGGRDQPVSAA
jgi:hypothetical protein